MKPHLLPLVVVCSMGHLVAATVAAESPSGEALPELEAGLHPSVQASLSPEGPHKIGDAVTLLLEVEADAADRISLLDPSLAPFELLETDHAESTEGNRTRHRFTGTLLLWEPGEHELELALRVLTGDGALGRVPVPPMTVSVHSNLEGITDAEAKAASDPLPVVEKNYALAWLALVLVLVGLLVFAAFRVGRILARRKLRERPPPPPRPPWEVALEALAQLEGKLRRDKDDHDHEHFADALSDTLRGYLGRRYGFEGLESTSEEVVAELRKRRPPSGVTEEVVALLGDLDLVKFAKAAPSHEQGLEQLACGVRIVEQTQPRMDASDAGSTSSPRPQGAT